MVTPLYVSFVWHMHQPFYRDSDDGLYSLPWVRLHAVKDYLHIARVIADYPDIRQTINVVPSLGQQIAEYASGSAVDRPLHLSAKLASGIADLTDAERAEMLDSFFSINWDHFVLPIPRYSQLARLREAVQGDHRLLSNEYFVDLAAWYNLAWTDPSERKRDPELRHLVEKGKRFEPGDISAILDKHRAICGEIIPTYRRLLDQGQIELTTSPYYHPILPLLLDTNCARESSANLPLPKTRFRSEPDAERQIRDALEFHRQTFGQGPSGMWPPEGAISDATVNLVARFPEIHWIASDEHVLGRSLNHPIDRDEYGHLRDPSFLYRPYALGTSGPAIFFRDQTLSDRVGFVYQHWESVAAANDLVDRLLHAQQTLEGSRPSDVPPIVSIVLDGENCWETYPNNGDDFLRALFGRLSRELSLATVTPSEYLRLSPNLRDRLPRLETVIAASWIGGNLETWIGEPDQNRAWDYLATTRRQFEAWRTSSPEPERDALDRAWHAIQVAEGSDWFWWYYSHNRVTSIDAFDRHFREELATVYREMNQPAPDWLSRPIFTYAAARARDVVGPISPLPLDASSNPALAWSNAGYVDLDVSTGTMQMGSRPLQRLYYGYDETNLYLRVDAAPGTKPGDVGLFLADHQQLGSRSAAGSATDRSADWEDSVDSLDLTWLLRASRAENGPILVKRRIDRAAWEDVPPAGAFAASESAIEFAIPREALRLHRGTALSVAVALVGADTPLDGSTFEAAVTFTVGERDEPPPTSGIA